ncbi:MAG: electron transport complex subunit E [Magnetococcales bacterium]|nr:electron transport complex subunit E [Magnetococcales bacterium]
MSELTSKKVVLDGLWYNNNIFVQMLGMCPTLAVSTNTENGIGMGLATTGVLLGSNVIISMIRKVIPQDVRIPAYIIVIAAFVTIVDLLMNAYFLELHKTLGIFIPLIVVNCVILGRAEAFASKYGVFHSTLDAISTGIGFTLALVVLGSVREILGAGQWWGMDVMGASFHPAISMILPPGAFIALGFIMAGTKGINLRIEAAAAAKAKESPAAPAGAEPSPA